MKEFLSIGKEKSIGKNRELLEALFMQIGVAVISFIASRGVVAERLLPFGIAFLAGCPHYYCASSALGAFLGYFIPITNQSGFRYIASLFAVLAIKLILSSNKRLSSNPLFCGVVALLANGITAAVAAPTVPAGFVDYLSETLLCALGAFFTCKTALALKRDRVGLSGEELASLLIVSSIILTGLNGISLYGVSVGCILGVFLILTAAKYGGTLAGAISGIAVSFSNLLGGNSNTGLYYFGGMMAGVFSPLGKYSQIAAMGISTIISALYTPDADTIFPLIAQTVCGSLIFLFLPRSAGVHLGKVFAGMPKITMPSGIKKAATLRLNLASNALKDISHTVAQVSEELSRINAPDFNSVISGVERDVCKGCKLRIHCWESKKEATVEAILQMTRAIKNGEEIIIDRTDKEFRGRCLKPDAMAQSVAAKYTAYSSAIAAENRIEEVRQVVSDQFEGISNMLEDLSLDLSRDEKFDNSAALSAVAVLRNLNIHSEECCARIDKFGRMTLEIRIKKDSELTLNKMRIMKALSLACERDFDIPVINEAGGDIYISVSEHAIYKIDMGVTQVCADNGNMCGDAFNCFNDGKGHYIAVLSDGMGTGGRAAVDGAMASGLMARLLKAGFGFNCSLRILNSSMLFKSTDESLATVDIASIDLFTGETELYKAGAAPTLVRRSGRTGKAESTSLPVGILRDIGFDRAAIKLKADDILLLMSDGAISEGIDWIRAELEAFRDGTAKDLSKHIAECARARRSDAHEDDITVIALMLERCP